MVLRMLLEVVGEVVQNWDGRSALQMMPLFHDDDASRHARSAWALVPRMAHWVTWVLPQHLHPCQGRRFHTC